MSDDDRGPISWEALAAELAATREEAGPGSPDDDTWDAVAAELAARVAERPPADGEPDPAPVGEPPPLPAPVAPPAAPPGQRPQSNREPGPDRAAERDREPEPEAADPAVLRGGLEALLFVVDTPVDEPTLAAALRCPVERVRTALAELGEEYDRRRAGIALRRVGEGWRLYTREEHADVVERHLGEGQRSRLSQAALETLAVVAYRQPVTRARISAIRGVGVDAVMRTLVNRGLVAEVGTDADSGAGLYATTPLFLEKLGLGSLDELPELGPLLPDASTVLDEHPDA